MQLQQLSFGPRRAEECRRLIEEAGMWLQMKDVRNGLSDRRRWLLLCVVMAEFQGHSSRWTALPWSTGSLAALRSLSEKDLQQLVWWCVCVRREEE